MTLWIALAGAAVRAQEKEPPPPKPFAEARNDYEDAAQRKDAKQLAKAVDELARSGFLSDDKSERAYVKGALKRCLKHRATEVRTAAARGFGVLRVPGSSRDLRAALRQAGKLRQPREVALALLVSWGEIHDPGTHKDLIELFEKPTVDKRRIELAHAAAEALRGFRVLPRHRRAEIVGDLMQVFDQLFNIAHRRVDTEAPRVKYWTTIEPSLVKAFNSLTRQRLESYYECADWWQKNRREMKSGER